MSVDVTKLCTQFRFSFFSTLLGMNGARLPPWNITLMERVFLEHAYLWRGSVLNIPVRLGETLQVEAVESLRHSAAPLQQLDLCHPKSYQCR